MKTNNLNILAIIKLALLNIIKNQRKTSVAFITIIIGITALVSMGGFIQFNFEGLRESTIRTQLGHFQIYKTGYRENSLKNPYNYLIQDYTKLSQDLKDNVSDIDTITQRLNFSGLIAYNNLTFSALFIGTNPSIEQGFSSFEIIVNGAQIDDDNSNQAVLGEILANSLGVKIGDNISVLTNTIDGMINVIDLQVKGIARTGSKEYDKVFVKIPLKLMQSALDTTKVASILILLNNTESQKVAELEIKKVLQKYGNKYTYLTWLDLAEFYQGVYNLYNGFFNLFQLVIGIIIFFSIYNTISTSIFERTKEIGTLRALGFSKTDVIKIFLTEGFLLGVLGSILGLIIAIIVTYVINLNGGIYVSPPPGQSTGYDVEILLVPSVMLKTVLTVILTSTLASIYPSIVASKKNIIKALKHV